MSKTFAASAALAGLLLFSALVDAVQLSGASFGQRCALLVASGTYSGSQSQCVEHLKNKSSSNQLQRKILLY